MNRNTDGLALGVFAVALCCGLPLRAQDTITLELQKSADLSAWETVAVTGGKLDAEGRIVVPVTGVRQFYRMRVVEVSGFVLVEAGTAAGGSPTVSEDFYIGKYEVTNQQMAEVMQWAHDQSNLIAASASTVSNAQGKQQELLDLDDEDCQVSFAGGTFSVESGKENYPCVLVTWYGAAAWCNYRSAKDGLTPCYDLADWSCNSAADGYRLPTDDEWEYSARGG